MLLQIPPFRSTTLCFGELDGSLVGTGTRTGGWGVKYRRVFRPSHRPSRGRGDRGVKWEPVVGLGRGPVPLYRFGTWSKNS